MFEDDENARVVVTPDTGFCVDRTVVAEIELCEDWTALELDRGKIREAQLLNPNCEAMVNLVGR